MTDRVPFGGLTDAEIDAIAERAAKKALQSVTTQLYMATGLTNADWLQIG